LFIVRQLGLRLGSLILNCDFIVRFSGKLLALQGPEILLFAVHHQEYLPRVSILGDPTVLGAAEVVHIPALEELLVRTNYVLEGALGEQNVNESLPLFLYLY
jgi:hypothetical protein